MISLAILIYWLVCLVRQTPEEYEDIKRSVGECWM